MREQVDGCDDTFVWPSWIALAATGIVAVTLGAAIWQRVVEDMPLAMPVLGALLAITPFVTDDVAQRLGIEVPDRIWLTFFPIPVVTGVGLMITSPTNVDASPFVLVFMCAELASRWTGGVIFGLVPTVASAGLMLGIEVAGLFDGGFIWVIAVGFGYFGGMLVRQLAERTSQLEQAQAGLAEKAATDERQRIAREVHDVIAHSLSVTMLHVTAARMATERGRDDEAIDALREAERHGRSSLADIRRIVGLLGTNDTSVDAPMPTAADLPILIQDFRAAGLDVTLHVDGDVQGIPPAAGLDVYRITQESLTNVTKHAPGATASVTFTVTDDEIRLCVRNAPGNGAGTMRLSGNGMGVRGMIERAHTLDGRLAVDDADGWTVLLTAPRPRT